MTLATKSFHNRIVLIFDFDDTLAPSTSKALLSSLDMDYGKFMEEQVNPLVEQGWEKTLANAYCDENGEINFVKQIITHPEKVRYILQLAKGLGIEGPNSPSDVYQDVSNEELYVPLNQIVYVGDGASDMPAFRLMNEQQGIAIGVFKGDTAQKWDYQSEMTAQRQVQNLAPADYSPEGEMMQSLILATETICKQIALRRLSQGE